LGLASQPIAFNFDASNLSADLTSYKEAIKNLRRRMLHVENELRDKNTEVVALTNKIERDKKNKIDAHEERFLRLEDLVESLTSNLKELKQTQQKDHTTSTNSTEATAKAVDVIDKQVINIEENMGSLNKRLGKEVSENKSNIKKNWVTISGLKPLIDTKAEKVWLDHKADKEWVAEKLQTFTTTTANKSEVKKLSIGMLNNQKTVDTVKYQLEELMSQYYAQKKKNEGSFSRVQSKLGSHTQTNRALEVRIKNNRAGIEKLNEQFVDKVSGRPSDTVSFEELEKKIPHKPGEDGAQCRHHPERVGPAIGQQPQIRAAGQTGQRYNEADPGPRQGRYRNQCTVRGADQRHRRNPPRGEGGDVGEGETVGGPPPGLPQPIKSPDNRSAGKHERPGHSCGGRYSRHDRGQNPMHHV